MEPSAKWQFFYAKKLHLHKPLPTSMKKKTIIISSIVLIVIGFILSINAFAWSITTKEMLYIPLWVITIIGFLIYKSYSLVRYF